MRHNFGESGVLLGVWWGWWGSSENEGSGFCAPWEKTFLKKSFFPAGFAFKKKSWAFSFKRAVFWRPSFQRKVFLKKFFARKIAEFFLAVFVLKKFLLFYGVAALPLPAKRIVFSGFCAKMRPPENSGYSGSGLSAKIQLFFAKMRLKKHFTSTQYNHKINQPLLA